MTKFTRRIVLAGGAAAAVLAPVATSITSHAAAPAVGKQAPGFYRYKLGDLEITVISDAYVSPKRRPVRPPFFVDASALSRSN
jgi:hypothetical protein